MIKMLELSDKNFKAAITKNAQIITKTTETHDKMKSLSNKMIIENINEILEPKTHNNNNNTPWMDSIAEWR